MDTYLSLVFRWNGTTDEFLYHLRSYRGRKRMIRFLVKLRRYPAEKRKALIHISNSLEAFRSEISKPDLFVNDPWLIERYRLLLDEMLLVNKGPWIELKILRDCMKHVALITADFRLQIAIAHLKHPSTMSGKQGQDVTSLLHPN